MKKLALIFTSLLLAGSALLFSQRASASWNPNLILDDVIFDDSGTMSTGAIQSFLDGFSSSCLKNYQSEYPNGYNSYGSNVSAATVIRRVADIYGVNPQVILATLEKEESLVTGGSGCEAWRYNSAMGMGCPDGGSCPAPGYEGFSRQVTKGTWLLKFGKERANGNVNWTANDGVGGDPEANYSGPMTQGCKQRKYNAPVVCYDGYWTIDGQTIHIDTGSTGSFYNYTPHFHGNQNFVALFEQWFGSTISSSYYQCHNASNVGGAASGAKVVANRYNPGDIDYLSLVFLNNTGTACIEAHTWNSVYQGWVSNVATNHPAVDPADSEIIRANVAGDSKSELVFIKYRGTASGKIEMHVWDSTYQHWANNVATNHPAVDPANDRVVALDINHDGRDELALVKYQNTGSGKIEIHTWNPSFQGWVSNIATNHPAVNPTTDKVISLDVNGDGDDELALVKYQNTGSGKIEIHTWLYGQQAWYSNVATNHPAVASADNIVLSADINNDRRDELILARYRGTGSGRIEIHTWALGQQSWLSNVATNHPTLP